MRLKRNSTKNSELDSTASSVKSADSYGAKCITVIADILVVSIVFDRNIRTLSGEEFSIPHDGNVSVTGRIFASACSDCSECEYGEERKQNHSNYGNISSSSCTNLSFHSAAERESQPLLLNPNLTHAYSYKSITSSTDTLGPGELSASDIIATYKRTLNKAVVTEKNRQSSLVTIFSVWNTIMGSSLLTMAWGVERAGLPAALFLLVFMAALCLYTAHVLLTVNYNHGSETCEVPALCRKLLGASMAAVAHAFSLLVLLGANVLYWLLISNFLYYTVNYLMDFSPPNATVSNTSVLCPAHDALITPSAPLAAPSPYWGLHTTVPFYVAVIVFPLLNFTKVSFFTKFNSLGTLSVFYLMIFIIVKGWTWGINMGALTESAHGSADAAVLSGMLALSFYIHNIIITIMSNNARQEKNGRDLTIAFLLVTVTYALVGVVFYICFPLDKSCIEDNILNNFEMHDVMTAIARALLLFQVITVYPLVVFMLRCEAAQLWARAAARGPTLGINLAVVALCILVACLCPNIGTVIRYTGAVSGLVHVFALPALLQMRSLQLRGKMTAWKGLFYFAIIVFGTGNLVMQFFIV